MKDEAINMQMTKSFRVSHDIAARVEAFARVHMSPNFIFKGVDYGESKDTIESQAFISRTNSALISEMIRLNDLEVSYNLTRPVDQIFKLPLTLMSLKPGKYVSPEFKHLKEDMDYYYKHIQDLRLEYASLNSFLLARHPDDVNLKSAVSLISKYGSKDIWAAYNHAKSHEHKNSYLTLCTAHSSKGLEFDHVEIADDLNSVIDRYKDTSYDQRDNHQQEEFRLYYVAVTRAKKSLTNDKHLYFQEVA
jgi:superfamily I DNA/RNA helicase